MLLVSTAIACSVACILPTLCSGQQTATTVLNGPVGINTPTTYGMLDAFGGVGTNFIYTEIPTGQIDYTYNYLELFKLTAGIGWNSITLNANICATRSDDGGITQCAEVHVSRSYDSSIYFSETVNAATTNANDGPFQLVTVNNSGSTWVSLLYDTHTGPGPISWTVSGTLFDWDDDPTAVSLTDLTSTTPVHTPLQANLLNTTIPFGNVGIDTTSPNSNLQIGNTAPASTASPNTLSLGGTYSTAAGSNAKLKLYDDGISSDIYGLGVSSGSLDAVVPTAANYNWYIGGANKMILNSSGNVGIGTMTPSVPLEVNGSVKMDSGVLVFPDGSTLSSTATLNQLGLNGGGVPVITQANGNVGIGTANPGSALDVVGAQIQLSNPSGNTSTAANYSYLSSNAYTYNTQMLTLGTTYGFSVPVNALSIFNGGVSIGSYAGANIGQSGSLIVSGNIGIGTTSPQAKLDVNGAIRISGSGAGLTFPDGSVQSTAYTGTCPSTGGDYAESVDVEGDKKSYEPGDVMVLASGSHFDVTKSYEPYSTLVAGIYSTKPGYVGRRQTSDPKLSTKEIPMAMVGIVPTKVTTENGPIHRGDLLVTASRSGFAMKGTDHSRMMGAVVGKAMGSLESGTGVIEVLVSLQ